MRYTVRVGAAEGSSRPRGPGMEGRDIRDPGEIRGSLERPRNGCGAPGRDAAPLCRPMTRRHSTARGPTKFEGAWRRRALPANWCAPVSGCCRDGSPGSRPA